MKIKYYKEQSQDEKNIDFKKINNEKITIIDLKNKNNSLDQKFNNAPYIGNSIIMLSYPFFTKNKEYALISYYNGVYKLGGGNESVAIYQKVDNKWVVYKRLLLGIE